MIKILMIEDDYEFAQLLERFFENKGLEITCYEDPFLALSCGIRNYDIVILDLTLPGLDGLEVCKKIRDQHNIPIIISSARSDLDDKLVGFENGADDYLPKPYDPKEMLARIMALMKRSNSITNKSIKKEIKSNFTIKGNDIYFKDQYLELTAAENEILQVLLKHFNQTLSREFIVESCPSLNDDIGKTLSTLIGRIKQKTSNDIIQTVRGIGYKLVK
jgi:two-component system OmpR family response regulator